MKQQMKGKPRPEGAWRRVMNAQVPSEESPVTFQPTPDGFGTVEIGVKVWPIARITVNEDDTVTATLYTPGLPPGSYDVFLGDDDE